MTIRQLYIVLACFYFFNNAMESIAQHQSLFHIKQLNTDQTTIVSLPSLLINRSNTLKNSIQDSNHSSSDHITLYNTLEIPDEQYIRYLKSFSELISSISNTNLLSFFKQKKFDLIDIMQFYHMLVYLEDLSLLDGKKTSDRIVSLLQEIYAQDCIALYDSIKNCDIKSLSTLLFKAPLNEILLRIFISLKKDTSTDKNHYFNYLVKMSFKERYSIMLHPLDKSFEYIKEVFLHDNSKKVSSIGLTQFLRPNTIQYYHRNKSIIAKNGMLFLYDEQHKTLVNIPNPYERNYIFYALYKKGVLNCRSDFSNKIVPAQYKFCFKLQHKITQKYYLLDLDHFFLKTSILNVLCKNLYAPNWSQLVDEIQKKSHILKGSNDFQQKHLNK